MRRGRVLSYKQARLMPAFRMIQDAVAAEGSINEKGQVVVPDDLFRRLGEKLSTAPREGSTMFRDAANAVRDGK